LSTGEDADADLAASEELETCLLVSVRILSGKVVLVNGLLIRQWAERWSRC
jgi:hypothetical protein